jgi:hypothetical protein
MTNIHEKIYDAFNYASEHCPICLIDYSNRSAVKEPYVIMDNRDHTALFASSNHEEAKKEYERLKNEYVSQKVLEELSIDYIVEERDLLFHLLKPILTAYNEINKRMYVEELDNKKIAILYDFEQIKELVSLFNKS